eukprot:TRINITY_DN2581_c0_g1_i1.p1 TRINITY_DN2581_c0_g1~~TRINITY_DN2581_c0_g1_i1.p1  ORF type:complete len:1695 (-),score=294.12 TRINITY_DN2581_c0_g1_i1:195-4715(-)
MAPPLQAAFPATDFDVDLTFSLLSVENIVKIIECMVGECKIVFLSSKARLLATVTQTFLTLMWPFNWEHVFIPLLPQSMAEFLLAPFPFITGVIWNTETVHCLNREADVVVVDLDRDTIALGTACPTAFPPEAREALVQDLYKLGRPRMARIDNALPGYFAPQEKHDSFEAIKYTCDPDTVYKRLIQIAFFKVWRHIFFGVDFSTVSEAEGLTHIEGASQDLNNFYKVFCASQSFHQYFRLVKDILENMEAMKQIPRGNSLMKLRSSAADRPNNRRKPTPPPSTQNSPIPSTSPRPSLLSSSSTKELSPRTRPSPMFTSSASSSLRDSSVSPPPKSGFTRASSTTLRSRASSVSPITSKTTSTVLPKVDVNKDFAIYSLMTSTGHSHDDLSPSLFPKLFYRPCMVVRCVMPYNPSWQKKKEETRRRLSVSMEELKEDNEDFLSVRDMDTEALLSIAEGNDSASTKSMDTKESESIESTEIKESMDKESPDTEEIADTKESLDTEGTATEGTATEGTANTEEPVEAEKPEILPLTEWDDQKREEALVELISSFQSQIDQLLLPSRVSSSLTRSGAESLSDSGTIASSTMSNYRLGDSLSAGKTVREYLEDVPHYSSRKRHCVSILTLILHLQVQAKMYIPALKNLAQLSELHPPNPLLNDTALFSMIFSELGEKALPSELTGLPLIVAKFRQYQESLRTSNPEESGHHSAPIGVTVTPDVTQTNTHPLCNSAPNVLSHDDTTTALDLEFMVMFSENLLSRRQLAEQRSKMDLHFISGIVFPKKATSVMISKRIFIDWAVKSHLVSTLVKGGTLFRSLLQRGSQHLEKTRLTLFLNTLKDLHFLYSGYSLILSKAVLAKYQTNDDEENEAPEKKLLLNPSTPLFTKKQKAFFGVDASHLHDFVVLHQSGVFYKSVSGDLILTNKSLIFVHPRKAHEHLIIPLQSIRNVVKFNYTFGVPCIKIIPHNDINIINTFEKGSEKGKHSPRNEKPPCETPREKSRENVRSENENPRVARRKSVDPLVRRQSDVRKSLDSAFKIFVNDRDEEAVREKGEEEERKGREQRGVYEEVREEREEDFYIVEKEDESSENEIVFYKVKQRSFWHACIMEVLSGHVVSRDLRDPSFLMDSCKSVLLSQTVATVMNITHDTCFFDNEFKKGFSIIEPIRKIRILNEPWRYSHYKAEDISEASSEPASYSCAGKSRLQSEEEQSPCHIITELLSTALQLMFSFTIIGHDASPPVRKSSTGDKSPKRKEAHSTIAFDKLQQSREFQSFVKRTASILFEVNLHGMNSTERMAFLINLYNLMVIHGYMVSGRFPSSIIEWRYFSRFVSYRVRDGDDCFNLSLDMIVSLLRGKNANVNVGDHPFHPDDPQLNLMLDNTDPRIHFLLCSHNKSSPKIRILSPQTLEVYMEAASFDYCEREIKVFGKQVILPMIFYWYQSDFLGMGEQDEDEDSLSGSSEEEKPKKNPLAIIRWLTQRQAGKIAKMVSEGSYKVSYEWDWTPNPSPPM